MRFPVRNIELSAVGLGILLACSPFSLLAQDAIPETDRAPVAPATSGGGAGLEPRPSGTEPPEVQGAASSAPATSTALQYLYERKPQEGSVASQAATVGERAQTRAIATDALGVESLPDSQAVARFRRYLALPEVDQTVIQDYTTTLSQTTRLLQEGNAFEAWKNLLVLSESSQIDAGVSRELANRVESVWDSDRATTQISRRNEQLRSQISGTNRNADMLADSVREKEVDFQRRTNRGGGGENKNEGKEGDNTRTQTKEENGGGTPSIDSVIGKLQITDAYLRTLEAKARIKLNEVRSDQLIQEAKSNFAEYITTLFNSGRHQHVILAADFYRRIFNSSEYPVAMAQQVNASLEMAREVQSAVEVVKYKLDSNSVATGATQLQSAFATNDLNVAVLGLERTYKAKVETFFTTLDRMQNLIEAREFTDLEELLGRMREIAPDFDATKARAIVNGVKLESQLRLGKAKIAAQKGDLNQAMEEFQAAAQVWPSNPDLQSNALTFFDSQDIQSESLREFDRLVQEQNYRAIFDKQLAFTPAMKDDSARQGQLKDALEKIKAAEVAWEKANLQRTNGDVNGAWETVELAVSALPNDLKLNTLRGELSGRAAEFVAAINRAKEADARKELGYSLTWYAIAQRQYPASQIANKAIERLSELILSDA